MNTIDTVAVFGTLKKGLSNYWSMQRANWEFVWIDYVEVDGLEDCGFPMVTFKKWSGKWLEVELYNVPIEGIEWPLDSLEGYTPNSPYNLYNRVKIETKWGRTVWIYEIVRPIKDELETFYKFNEWEDLFYKWGEQNFNY